MLIRDPHVLFVFLLYYIDVVVALPIEESQHGCCLSPSVPEHHVDRLQVLGEGHWDKVLGKHVRQVFQPVHIAQLHLATLQVIL